jgi:acyl-CoA hydrolase
MTPAELNIYVEAYVENKENEQRENIYQAYLISRWVWAKKIDIKKYLNTSKKKKQMTDEQMLNQVKMLNAVFGGEVEK